MPKKKSSELYDLVHLLSKNEAGYFKKFSARHSSEENLDYVLLFNLISRQKKHDDTALQQQYKFRNFSRLKNYLYQSLLQSLYSYHSGSNSNTLLRKYINDIELLYGKALYRQCKKLLKKAKALALLHEKFNAVTELINWEIRILQANTELEALQKNSERFLKENLEAFEKMQNTTQYIILYSRIFSLIRTRGPARSHAGQLPYDNIMKDKLLRRENQALSGYALMLYYHIHTVNAFACHQPEKENYFSRSLVTHIEKNPALFEEEKERYLISLNNLISSSIRMGNFEEAARYILRLKALPVSGPRQPDSNNLAHRVFARSFILELFLHNRKGEADKALAVISRHEQQLKKTHNRINLANLTELYYRIAYSYFIAGEYKRSLAWVNKLLNDKTMSPINEFYSYSLLLNIIIHIELKNFEYAFHLVKNTFGSFKKQGKLNSFENALIKCLHNVSSAGHAGRPLRKIFAEHTERIKKTAQDPYEMFILYQFDMLSWLQSKLNNKTFADTIRSGK